MINFAELTKRFEDSAQTVVVVVVVYATADEADAYMFYRCFFCFFLSLFCFFLFFFPSVKKIPDNRSWERLNGFS